MKGSRDVEHDRAHALLASRLGRHAQPLQRTGEHHLPGRVVIGHDHPVLLGKALDLLLRRPQHREHPFRIARLRNGHQLAASDRELEARQRVERAGGDERAELTQRVPGECDGAHAPAELHPAGDARAEDRGLREPRAVADAGERILTDEIDALLAQRGRRALHALTKIACLASLTREQPRYHA